jgi:hypothetical protein
LTLQHFDNQMLKAEDLPTLPVAVAYSLLRATPHDKALLHKLQRQLEMDLEGSTPFWRRATQAQSLWALACFISAGLTQGQSLRGLMAPFLAKVHTLLE